MTVGTKTRADGISRIVSVNTVATIDRNSRSDPDARDGCIRQIAPVLSVVTAASSPVDPIVLERPVAVVLMRSLVEITHGIASAFDGPRESDFNPA